MALLCAFQSLCMPRKQGSKQLSGLCARRHDKTLLLHHFRKQAAHAWSAVSTAGDKPSGKYTSANLQRVWQAGIAISVGCLTFQLLSMGLPERWMPASRALLNSPNAQIARSADAALRRATPAANRDVKQVQTKLEDIQFLLRIPQRKPWSQMARDAQEATALVALTDRMLEYVPAGKEAQGRALVELIIPKLERLLFAIDRKDPEKTALASASALQAVSALEVLQAPGLPFRVPQAYAEGPLLTGRAEVRFVVKKADGSAAFVNTAEGGMLSEGCFVVTLDGYSAPVSAGAFAQLVADGKYDGCRWSSSYASVVAGGGVSPGSKVPLEILPLGEFEPMYRVPLDVRSGELPVLPLSIRGSVSMGRNDGMDGYLSGDEFFIFKFDAQQAGLSGLAFDEGEFGVFGYVTSGMNEVVARLESGDRIISASLISGADRLVLKH